MGDKGNTDQDGQSDKDGQTQEGGQGDPGTIQIEPVEKGGAPGGERR